MNSSLLIANEFIRLAGEGTLTHMQVQKLVYFAHALSLAATGRPLIRESFLAFQFGPVEPELYEKLRAYGSNPVHVIPLQDASEKIWNVGSFLVKVTYDKYKGYDAYRLSKISHVEGGPWDLTWRSRPYSIIKNDDIAEFYNK